MAAKSNSDIRHIRLRDTTSPLSYVIRGSCKNVLSLGSDYFSTTFFIKHIFITNLQSIPPLLKHIFVTFLPSREKQINSLLLVSVGDTDK